MKRVLYLIICFFCSIGISNAAVRTDATVSRSSTPTNRSTTVTSQRTNISRNGSVSRTATASQTRRTDTLGRSGTNVARTGTRVANLARAALSRATSTISTKTFDNEYSTCRDAYFTCMDQFCATANDAYRRCICSSRLADIQKREKALSETAESLQNFQDLNLEIIPKTANEVKAMLTASTGEIAAGLTKKGTNKDKSDSANTLAQILTKTKSESLSTQGTLDIGGNINNIRIGEDLTSGANIANLTGEKLYNAVNAQCQTFVSDKCPSQSILNMIVSAYGMYIENDCALLSNNLTVQKYSANSAIRDTEHTMNSIRLENYNAHNSSSINTCIANVRADITSDVACGTDYIHCMDVSGLYLSKLTGEPIYTPNFYQLENQISLSGDVLKNQTNNLLIAELNNKRKFAANSLNLCTDLSDDVWDEFMRQAITEIYQGQQKRIRQVKDECLSVVNACYDEQRASLKDFSNIDEKLLLGANLELSEEMCRTKLDTCSKLYSHGVTTNGMQELLTAMHKITDQKIESNCITNLQNFVRNMCIVPGTDTIHSYPYACRVYAPGEHQYALYPECNSQLVARAAQRQAQDAQNQPTTPTETCTRTYTSCFDGYQLENGECLSCDDGKCTPDPDEDPTEEESDESICNDDGAYVGSLYQKLVNYASQVCIRPSDAGKDVILPESILQDVSTVMNAVKSDMAKELAKECERLGGVWISTPQNTQNNNLSPHTRFYDETSANTRWGYCSSKSTE